MSAQVEVMAWRRIYDKPLLKEQHSLVTQARLENISDVVCPIIMCHAIVTFRCCRRKRHWCEVLEIDHVLTPLSFSPIILLLLSGAFGAGGRRLGTSDPTFRSRRWHIMKYTNQQYTSSNKHDLIARDTTGNAIYKRSVTFMTVVGYWPFKCHEYHTARTYMHSGQKLCVSDNQINAGHLWAERVSNKKSS